MRRPSSTIAAAVSSQDVSIPSTRIDGGAGMRTRGYFAAAPKQESVPRVRR
jgi:hypothetical protein